MAKELSYWKTGMEQAYLTLAIDRTKVLTAEGVRAWINNVPPETSLSTWVADFWLRLKPDVGPHRRKHEPPANPFTDRTEGNSIRGRRDKIEVWHRAWIDRVGVEAQYEALDGAQDSVSLSIRSELEKAHPWLIRGGKIVGWALGIGEGLMDRAFADPNDLDIEVITLPEVLRREWFDRDERALWLRALQRLHIEAQGEQRRALEDLPEEVDRGPMEEALAEQERADRLEYAELARLVLGEYRV